MKTCKFICPYCKTVWGTLKFNFESVITKDNIIPLPEYKNKTYIKEDYILCPKCQYKYTIYDIWKMIALQLDSLGTDRQKKRK